MASCPAEKQDATEFVGILVSNGQRNVAKREWEEEGLGKQRQGTFWKWKIIFSSIEEQVKNITGEFMYKK